jgi:hypothetical protein
MSTAVIFDLVAAMAAAAARHGLAFDRAGTSAFYTDLIELRGMSAAVSDARRRLAIIDGVGRIPGLGEVARP